MYKRQLQGILDKYLETNGNVEIDYIPGDEELHGLVKETKGCGIFLQSIDKSTLFPAINAVSYTHIDVYKRQVI